jgi:hypothetical protein
VEDCTYILPIRRSEAIDDELISYLGVLSRDCEVIVVDGSPPEIFRSFSARCGIAIRHVPPDQELAELRNGKVAGVLTGLRLASHERVVIADDDVRYDRAALEAVCGTLDTADVVRPQNYFDPLPWHARLDTARTLINRITGGDWPGTMAVRRSTLRRTAGYDGNVLFENLELVRTILSVGGTEAVRPDVYVRRLPPRSGHFVSQRVRQAYDEFARPVRLLVWLSVLPLLALIAINKGARIAAAAGAVSIVVAEAGRRVHGGARVFPASTSLLAPLWLLERGVSAWLAVTAHGMLGGVPYHGRVLRTAATPMRQLRRRHRRHFRPSISRTASQSSTRTRWAP